MQKRLLLCGCALAITQAVPISPVIAQQSAHPAVTWPIDSVLKRFERDKAALRSSPVPYEILDLPRSFAARQDSLLDGLERLALDRGTNIDVRRSSVLVLATAGEVRSGYAPLPGVMRRLARIYRAQPLVDPSMLRAMIRAALPMQNERASAIALLREAASEPDDRGPDPVHGYFTVGEPRTDALAQLALMGEQGRAALEAMHRRGEARSPQARIILEQMAREGFPVTDAQRPRPRP
ncbi:MAG TPA: hypothetical protein VFJ82_13575 [Longimicrobium sp.]|nr:hypothetical protein [Longimicrobium sp.]